MESSRRSKRLQNAGQGTPKVTPKTKRPAKKPPAPIVQDQIDADIDPHIDPPPNEISPSRICQPISTAVHCNLANAWRINRALPMCFIFDSVHPGRMFKRDMLFDEKRMFPVLSQKELENFTETDQDPPNGLMPYTPKKYT